MVDDPRDSTAYRIAIGMLGFAFVVALAGVCWVAAEHKCPRNIPEVMWLLPAATGGVFAGALIPFSLHRLREDPSSRELSLECTTGALGAAVVLAVAAAGAVAVGIATEKLALSGVGAALGALFFGLFIPSPGRRDP